MKYRDYYAVLGVEKNADAQRIKQAYRRLARRHHPDLNPGDRSAAERFKEIGEAYEVLSDPDRRRRYDRLGANWGRHQRDFRDGPARSGPGPRPDPGSFSDFSSFFLHLFGPDSPFGPLQSAEGRPAMRWQGSRHQAPPPDPHEQLPQDTAVEISLEEASRGVVREVQSGDRKFRVRIPAGIADGARLSARIPGGEANLVVRVARHPRFRRDGDDLEVAAPVGFAEATLGGEIEVPTLEGSARIRIPPGISGGTGLRIRGRGMPREGGGRGDLVARVRIVVPKDLTREQQDVVRRFSRSAAPPRK